MAYTDILYGAKITTFDNREYFVKMDVNLSHKVQGKMKDYIIKSGNFFKLQDVPVKLKPQIEALIKSRHIQILEEEPAIAVENTTVVDSLAQEVTTTTVEDVVAKLLKNKEQVQVVSDIVDTKISKGSELVQEIKDTFKGLESVTLNEINQNKIDKRQEKLIRLKAKRKISNRY